MIHHAKLDSSVVASITHDPETSQLEVRMHSGALYRYSGVDVKTFAAFLTADSPGRFYNARIKGRYDRIDADLSKT